MERDLGMEDSGRAVILNTEQERKPTNGNIEWNKQKGSKSDADMYQLCNTNKLIEK